MDVEAERAEEEAALKALREKPPPPAEEENVDKDEFVKKKGGFMARFLAKKMKSDADVDGAIAAAEAQENANQKSADAADVAAAAGTNAGAVAAGAHTRRMACRPDGMSQNLMPATKEIRNMTPQRSGDEWHSTSMPAAIRAGRASVSFEW